jgi:hypothetical protein
LTACYTDGLLYCVTIPLAGPNAHGAIHGGDPDFPVANRFGTGMLGDRSYYGLGIVIEDEDI